MLVEIAMEMTWPSTFALTALHVSPEFSAVGLSVIF